MRSNRYREMSNEECTLNRFIVWVAVKRNDSVNITCEQMRECPMLRCRRRFHSHELMLQHLYSCDHLATGEYWCCDCGKAEQLNDVKCRRCLGHPSRVKKMMSMAKSFFSSLGHKPKMGGLPDSPLGMDDDPPSYGFAIGPPEAELQSNPIHEIDSFELPLPTIPEGGEEQGPFSACLTGLASPSSFLSPRQQYHTGAVAGQCFIDESLINWDPAPASPPRPDSESLPRPDAPKAPCRPALQLSTQNLATKNVVGYYRARSRRRSKMLVPSLSVRSTASATSTNSTLSTTSANISPMSTWSGALGRATGYDSALTSPADDGPAAADMFQLPDKYCRYQDALDHDVDLQGIAPLELPADRPIFYLPLAPESSVPAAPPAPTRCPVSGETLLLPVAMSMVAPGGEGIPREPRLLEGEVTRNRNVGASSLIQTAQDVLEVHLESSMNAVRGDDTNHVIGQFRNMSPKHVAVAGLGAMTDIFGGGIVTSAVQLVCFVHVVYAVLLVIDEQDAMARFDDLFIQAASYSSWLPCQDQQAYLQVVDFLWRPKTMADGTFMELLQTKLSRPEPSCSSSTQSKHATACVDTDRPDPLVFVAQYYLDGTKSQEMQRRSGMADVWTRAGSLGFARHYRRQDAGFGTVHGALEGCEAWGTRGVLLCSCRQRSRIAPRPSLWKSSRAAAGGAGRPRQGGLGKRSHPAAS